MLQYCVYHKCPVVSVGCWMINRWYCDEVSSAHYTYAAPLDGTEQPSRNPRTTFTTMCVQDIIVESNSSQKHYRQKGDSHLLTIIILRMPMVYINMIMAIGVNHHDLYNMHNYRCGNMAGYLCFTMCHTTTHIWWSALHVLDWLHDNAGVRPVKVLYFHIQMYIYRYVWPALKGCLCDFIQLIANIPPPKGW